jgi:UDP-glucuronate 4-epimerase
MHILLTGAAGFIGSHLAERLLTMGNSVIGIDNYDPFYSRKIKEANLLEATNSKLFTFIELDIRNKKSIDQIFSESKIDTVVHLAGKASIRPSIEFPDQYADVNINGTLNILDAMHHHKVSNLIFASSSSIYGNNEKIPFSEDDFVDQPISPYAATKKSAELFCHVYSHLFGLNINCLRFFTVYGPRQRPDLAIHKFTKLIDTQQPISLYGDQSTARDFTYIEDIIQGILGALNKFDGFNVYNLGESRMIHLDELIETIEKELNKKAIIKRFPLPPGDVQQTYANISKARKEINYNPKFDFEEGIHQFVSWYKANKEALEL